ncbi:RNA polymerase II mediator complex subunit [Exophiala xenobiotica]|nr:RNA polymerase II mediator complex subunit [Exophiala xenobiotica]KAK5558352.1 RNA polymerase II mediator complex subunit [Exophiala xenobiotica]
MPPRLILSVRRGRGQRGGTTTATVHSTGQSASRASATPSEPSRASRGPDGRERLPGVPGPSGSTSQNVVVGQRQHSDLTRSHPDITTSTTLHLSPDRLRQFPPGSSDPHITLRIRTRSFGVTEINSEATGTANPYYAPSTAAYPPPSLVPDAPLLPGLEVESSRHIVVPPASYGPSPEVYQPTQPAQPVPTTDQLIRNLALTNPATLLGLAVAAGVTPNHYEDLLPPLSVPRHHQQQQELSLPSVPGLPAVPDASVSRAATLLNYPPADFTVPQVVPQVVPQQSSTTTHNDDIFPANLPVLPRIDETSPPNLPVRKDGPQASQQSSTSTHGDNSDMAPVKDTSSVHHTLKDIIQSLSELQMQTHGYVPETQNLMVDKMTDLAESLSRLQTLTSPRESPLNPIHNVQVAPEIIDYVDDGRNPDIFTRDFVENVQRGNAVVNGKQQAFRDFTEIYAQALREGLPGTSRQVDKIMENLGFDNEREKEKTSEGTGTGTGTGEGESANGSGSQSATNANANASSR